MKLIIPMAGMGTRMRPHTLTIPKPLIKIAGKSIVQRLVEEIVAIVEEPLEEIAFIIGNFGPEVEKSLINIAESLGSKGKIYYQTEAKGTGHAIHCARESISGNVVVAFADTMFKADFSFDKSVDGIIWVKKVDDPSQFGVVNIKNNVVTEFVEKPKTFVSDLAIIGIYYFSKAELLRNELDYMIDNHVTASGEYQLTTALENLKNKNYKFGVGEVSQWLDCGNVQATIDANAKTLENVQNVENLIDSSLLIENSVIIEPCYIGANCKIINSIIGPYVSISDNIEINNSIIKQSIVNSNTKVDNLNAELSFIGNNNLIQGKSAKIDSGDYSKISL